jgi:hypothetical protein
MHESKVVMSSSFGVNADLVQFAHVGTSFEVPQ